MVRTREMKLNVYDGQPGELYDLRSDPQEFCNRLADGRYEQAARSMLARLNAWQQANRP